MESGTADTPTDGVDEKYEPRGQDCPWVNGDGIENYGYVGDWVYRESGETLVFRMGIMLFTNSNILAPIPDTRNTRYPVIFIHINLWCRRPACFLIRSRRDACTTK